MSFMANENKNIKELVADYSDPTVELEILSFANIASATVEDSASNSEIEKEPPGLPDSNQTRDDLISRRSQIDEYADTIRQRSLNQTERVPSAEKVSRVLIGNFDDVTLRFPLFKKSLTIGRTTDNDIQINAVYVSRRHAVIQTESGVTRIIDWGSKNGVRVNSDSISEHFLCHGDTIIIGNVRFRYEEHRRREPQ